LGVALALSQRHASGFTGLQIQIILRWDSLAFMVYFRNLAIIGDKQNRAVTFNQDQDGFEMANFF
jgi:hypothetical protein